MPHIKHIEIQKFWNKYQINWTLDPQVNILFGFNGSGKTTLLNSIKSVLHNGDIPPFIILELNNINIFFSNNTNKFIDYFNQSNNQLDADLYEIQYQTISTFDITIFSEKGKTSPLYQTLQTLVYGDGTSYTNHFEKYRSKRLDLLDEGKKEEADKIEDNIQLFYQIVNEFFAVSGKQIRFKEQKMFFENGDKKIELEQLSSGEKQLLIILLNVLLQDKQPYILLMDEPEISLHITWQQILIEKILELNPNCQLIIATHSPSVFGQGWRDKVVRMENLLTIEGT